MQPGPNTCLHICARQLAGKFVGCLPACTVSGHNDSWANSDQLRDGAGDNSLEEATGEMKASNKCMNLVNAREALRVPQNIDCPCVAATLKHDKPFVFH